MSSTKVCFFLVIVTILCVTSLVVAAPVQWIPLRTATSQQGSAVLFFVTHQGSLRDLLFNPVIFKHVVVNQGSAYNNNTGVFTAPVAGIYQFVFAAQLCRGDHDNRWYFMVNGAHSMLCHAQVVGTDTTLNTCYFMEPLKKGDRVWIKQNEGSCAWASMTSRTISFSGILLASEGVSRLGEKYSSCPLTSMVHSGNVKSRSAGRNVALSSVTITLLLSWFLLD